MMSVKATVAFLLVLFIFIPSVLAGSVTRSFSSTTVPPSGTLTVNIAVDVVSGENNYLIDEIYPSNWIVHSIWSNQNYCDANTCGDKDYDCGLTCENQTCDTTDQVWCDSGTWSSSNYCTQCGEYDYDCRASVTCLNGTCDIDSEYWCNEGTWTTTNYDDYCWKYDSDSCVLSGSICDRTCATDECDTDKQRWCSTDTDGGDTHENRHMKWAVISGASSVTNSYLIRAPSLTGTYQWSGIYMIEGIPSESSIGGQNQVTVAVTACSSYTTSSSCNGDSSCYWCNQCSGTQYSGGNDRCVDTGTCVYSCTMNFCGASCGSDNDCSATECDGLDGCDAGTYRDYSDMPNSCQGDCSCTSNACTSYTTVVTDNDLDGYDIECDNDCDDNPANCGAACNPGETEICDGYDNNCDGTIDEGCDDDNDDYCDENMVRASPYSCSGGNWCCPDGGNDCDDTVPSINPAAQEICDGVDNDCDDVTDQLTRPCGPENNTGICVIGYQECPMGPDWGVCKDAVMPKAETCNLGSIRALSLPDDEADDDCNGVIDNVVGGFCHCTGGVDPLSDEICPLNGEDDDCNGLTDEDSCDCEPFVDTHLCQDQYGVCAGSTVTCPAGGVWPTPYCEVAIYQAYSNDYESGNEVSCDGLDNNCDNQVDEGLTITFYRDFDGDTYGDPTTTTDACSQPVGYVTNSQDCNDTNGNVNPGETEICNQEDDNCDGNVDYLVTPGDLGCTGPVVITADYYDGQTTDFDGVSDTTNIVGMILEKSSFGMIEFQQAVNISHSTNLNPPFTLVGDNLVSINSSILSFLNLPAIIYLYNLTFTNPVILRNDQTCSSAICQIISYTGGNLTFSVTGFSRYSATGSCSDGTLYGECSSTRPRYCLDGALVNRAGICGCPSGYDVSGNDCVEEGDGNGNGNGGPVCSSGQQIACSVPGVCTPSYQSCVGGYWGACEGPDPETEECDGVDNNCNGLIDDGITCLCINDDIRTCGPSNETGVCSFGLSTCKNGAWGSCLDATYPGAEICDDEDNDCDGEVDEDCATNLCPDGAVPPEGCLCDTEVRTSGYCCSGIYSDDPCPINLWSILLYSGLFILILMFLLAMYFRSKGKELTWEGLKEEYKYSRT
jgi:hypothetical protein